MQQRRNILAGLLGAFGAGKVAKAAGGSDLERKLFEIPLFFTQRDTVVDFQPATGLGLQVGTVEGLIAGTSILNFQFIPISQTEINFDNRALITDLDGDQIIFRNAGRGRFIVPPLSDASSPLGNLMGVGGPLTGSYEAIRASGKFEFLIGRKFPYRSIATNPVRPGFPGQVYVEVYSDIIGGRQL
jgi:hypothetical protein